MTTTETIQKELQQRDNECAVMAALWKSMITAFCPSKEQFSLWLNLHTIETLRHSVVETGKKYMRTGCTMNEEYAIRYCSSAANNRTRGRVRRTPFLGVQQ